MRLERAVDWGAPARPGASSERLAWLTSSRAEGRAAPGWGTSDATLREQLSSRLRAGGPAAVPSPTAGPVSGYAGVAYVWGSPPQAGCDGFVTRAARAPHRVADPVEAAFDTLDALMVERLHNGSTPGLEERIGAAWEALRAAQAPERAAIRRELERSFELTASDLDSVLREARRLAEKLG